MSIDGAAPPARDPSATGQSAPGPSAHTSANHRALLSWVIRIAVSVALLAVLVWRLPDVKWNDLVPRWTSATPAWLCLGAALQLSALAFQTVRWATVLALFDRRVRFRRLFLYTLAGQFVSNVLPTSFGGDVIRVARVSRDLDDARTAFASVALERLVGWLVLPLISFTAIAISDEVRSAATHIVVALTVALVTVVSLLSILAAAAGPRSQALIGRRGWRGFLGSVHVGVDAMRTHRTKLVNVLLSGTAFQLVLCVSVWSLAHAVGISGISILTVCALFPAVAIAQNLPIGLGGLGVREGAFVYFFAGMDVSKASAISLGLTVYAITVAVSALGAPAFAHVSRPTKLHTGDSDRSV